MTYLIPPSRSFPPLSDSISNRKLSYIAAAKDTTSTLPYSGSGYLCPAKHLSVKLLTLGCMPRSNVKSTTRMHNTFIKSPRIQEKHGCFVHVPFPTFASYRYFQKNCAEFELSTACDFGQPATIYKTLKQFSTPPPTPHPNTHTKI